MPDITMCKNYYCEKKEKCYRYTVKPSKDVQAFDVFDPKQIDCFIERIIK